MTPVDEGLDDIQTTRLQAAVNWQAAGNAMKALARAATDVSTAAIEPLVKRLLAPLDDIDHIARLAARASAGDESAMDALHRRACNACEHAPALRGAFGRFTARPDASADQNCGCDARADTDVDLLTADDVLDESTLVELVLTVTSVAGVSGRIDAGSVLDLIVSKLIEAGPAIRLAQAHRIGGTGGLLAALRSLAGSGGMSFLMDGHGAPDLPVPLLSGNAPAIPGFPDDFEKPNWPSGLKPFRDILRELRSPSRWDREYWRPFVPFERDPIQYLPPGWLRLLSCLREVARRIEARAAIVPPPRPAGAVWADGIVRVEQSGACAGDVVRIHGSGFDALVGTAVLLLPFDGRCRPVAVSPDDWTDTMITVTLPADVTSGPIGFADAAYVAAYDAWAKEQDQLADEIRQYYCYRLSRPLVMAAPFHECPPDRVVNRLKAGAPTITAFTLNGLQQTYVEPGTSLVLAWTVRNADQIILNRPSSDGPAFATGTTITNPPGQSIVLGAFTGDKPTFARYTLTAIGPCGQRTAEVRATLTKIPSLRVTGVEVTQGIQKFRSPDGSDNELPVVASKDTVVRVYVAADGLGGFKPEGSRPDQITISGELRIGGLTLPPNANATAQPTSNEMRSVAGNTLNFKIPAALASGVKTMQVRAWTSGELPTAPAGELVRPISPWVAHTTTWINRSAFRVRYVRVSTSKWPAMSDAAARALVVRAFDLLPTPPLDIAPARIAEWHTGADLSTEDGTATLLEHLDDQHDCSISEWLFPWEDECPDDDGAVWVGITPVGEWGGKAQTFRLFDTSRNTAIVPPEKVVAAHELGHTRELHHVDAGGGFDDDEDFDDLPNGGAIRSEDVFDPEKMSTISTSPGFSGVYDFMSYAPTRWISATNWMRLFGKF